ncbi:hypothetical protein F511_14908 [Dorcoceras hygrometricum]|uniref:Uncharacterized protein n=1 Tax=Dorcoceras hygrometricum TaxID=472368 RepID=A0A2Z7B9M8_9LAMI|nr:hypothetical protein F511_14908 [Dorcoceras hygrometricum]
MHEGYQESSGNKAQRLSCADIIILLRSSGATTQPTITGQWNSGTTTQPDTTIATLDLSGTTTQPSDHNAQSASAHKGIKLNILRRTQLQQPAQIYYSPDSQKLRREMLKAAKGQKNHWTTIAKFRYSNLTITKRHHMLILKMTSIYFLFNAIFKYLRNVSNLILDNTHAGILIAYLLQAKSENPKITNDKTKSFKYESPMVKFSIS